MTPIREKLIPLYQEMAELTAPECRSVCKVPHSCCDPLYCQETLEWAKKTWGVTLPTTEHKRLPLMATDGTGCTAAPHLRPVCTLHTCAINSLGCKQGDPKWTKQYFKLRDQIELLELEQFIAEQENSLTAKILIDP